MNEDGLEKNIEVVEPRKGRKRGLIIGLVVFCVLVLVGVVVGVILFSEKNEGNETTGDESTSVEVSLEEKLEKVDEYNKAQLFDEAVKVIEEINEEDIPDEYKLDFYVNAINAYSNVGNTEKVEEYYRKVGELAEDDAEGKG
ncbi:MAG: hypothetical protein Q4B34_00165 [Candidatus Saccharibacteria bacterium]|nr:hypothetical protein [Candidatus Saccharibacteria bacterium]